MKNRILTLTLASLSLAALVSCGGNSGSNDKTSEITSSEALESSNNTIESSTEESKPEAGELESHTHTYDSTLSYNDKFHYYKATCGCIGEVKDLAPHKMADGKCSVCGFENESFAVYKTFKNAYYATENYTGSYCLTHTFENYFDSSKNDTEYYTYNENTKERYRLDDYVEYQNVRVTTFEDGKYIEKEIQKNKSKTEIGTYSNKWIYYVDLRSDITLGTYDNSANFFDIVFTYCDNMDEASTKLEAAAKDIANSYKRMGAECDFKSFKLDVIENEDGSQTLYADTVLAVNYEGVLVDMQYYESISAKDGLLLSKTHLWKMYSKDYDMYLEGSSNRITTYKYEFDNSFIKYDISKAFPEGPKNYILKSIDIYSGDDFLFDYSFYTNGSQDIEDTLLYYEKIPADAELYFDKACTERYTQKSIIGTDRLYLKYDTSKYCIIRQRNNITIGNDLFSTLIYSEYSDDFSIYFVDVENEDVEVIKYVTWADNVYCSTITINGVSVSLDDVFTFNAGVVYTIDATKSYMSGASLDEINVFSNRSYYSKEKGYDVEDYSVTSAGERYYLVKNIAAGSYTLQVENGNNVACKVVCYKKGADPSTATKLTFAGGKATFTIAEEGDYIFVVTYLSANNNQEKGMNLHIEFVEDKSE